MSKFETLVEELKAAQAKLQSEGKAIIKKAIDEVFEKNPAIKQISWTQYTPYFNDGDTCEFSVHEANFSNEVGYDEESEDEAETWCYSAWYFSNLNYRPKNLPELDLESINNLNKIIETPELEDTMKNIFGDHCKVVATREGIEVEDYYHD